MTIRKHLTNIIPSLPGFKSSKPVLEIRWVLLLSMFFFTGKSYTQGSLSQAFAAVESSYKLKEKCDSAHINSLNRVLAGFVSLYPDSVLVLLEGVQKVCDECKYTIGRVEALRLKGDAFNNKRMYDTALSILNEALLLAGKTGEPRSR